MVTIIPILNKSIVKIQNVLLSKKYTSTVKIYFVYLTLMYFYTSIYKGCNPYIKLFPNIFLKYFKRILHYLFSIVIIQNNSLNKSFINLLIKTSYHRKQFRFSFFWLLFFLCSDTKKKK